MDLQFEAVMDIKLDDVKKIITEYVEKDGKLKVVDIDFNLTTTTVGYGPGESTRHAFNKAKVRVRPTKSEFK